MEPEKKDGWSKFNSLTSNNKRLDDIVYLKGSDPNQLVKDFENAITKTKFQAFGKVKAGGVPKVDRDLMNLENIKQSVITNDNANIAVLNKIDEDIKAKLKEK